MVFFFFIGFVLRRFSLNNPLLTTACATVKFCQSQSSTFPLLDWDSLSRKWKLWNIANTGFLMNNSAFVCAINLRILLSFYA